MMIRLERARIHLIKLVMHYGDENLKNERKIVPVIQF